MSPADPFLLEEGHMSTDHPAVELVGPTARQEPRARAVRDGVEVVWSPERGWLCEEHTPQPCIHTEGLTPPRLPQEP